MIYKTKIISCLFLAALFLSCKHSLSKTPLFELINNTGIDFNNKVVDGKLENAFLFRNFYNGGGVAIGDINNDGLADVMFTSNMGDNKLYLNKGGFQFQDITATSGIKQDSMWSTGVTMVDINNDGWLDIYVCNSGHMTNGNRRNKLYINNHNNKFTESAAQYGLDISAYTTQVSFFDYDNDGDLDCFMINNSPIPVNTLNNANKRDLPDTAWPVAQFLKGGGDHLFRNDNGHFTEVTKQAGIHGSLISFGLGLSVGDVNGDGYPDVYISNDSYERDYLYINQKNGTFKDELEDYLQHTSMSSMGADLADINNDGYPDIFTTDMLQESDYRLKTTGSFDNIDLFNSKLRAGFFYQYVKNCLHLNNKDGKFIDIANYSGVSASDWSWGGIFFDADNDGYNDIFVCNGVNRDVTDLDFMDFFANDVVQKMVLTGKKEGVDQVLTHIPKTPMLSKAFRNLGNLHFEDAGKNWGFTSTSFSNGAAYGDLNNDGTLDLVVNNENGPAFVYKNNGRSINHNHYIGIKLLGTNKNTFSIGSKIKVFSKDQVFTREVFPSRGFQSSMDYKQIIGLGSLGSVDSMIITWPDHSYSRYDHPSVDTVHVIEESRQVKFHIDSLHAALTGKMLIGVASDFVAHHEDDHIDFYYERNLPELLSREGPHIARADVNGDGLEDIYIGGAKGQGGQLYVQTTKGFVKKEVPVFRQYASFEDVAVLFFDADGDGDMDLFVGSGGNNVAPNSAESQHRLYINDGHGNFILDANAFPSNSNNISVAVANDFNGDGYMDLFVGSRSVPYAYGVTPNSYLFLNDGHGHFKDVAPQMNVGIAKAGMVSCAVWADVVGDKRKELIIAGAFMAPRIFSYNGRTFDEQTNTGLGELSGWWQSVAAADVNGDGHDDLILGNIGENFYLQPDHDHPVRLWVNDFDNSGTMDQFLTRTVDGRDMPVFLKKEVTDQFPALKKNNLKHAEYATKSVQDLFSSELIEKSDKKVFNYPSSVVAINTGKGGFRIEKLPVMVQLSSVNAICVSDINKDGRPDLVLGGNMFGFPPQFGRLDGSYGHVLLNNGKGKYTWVEPSKSGLSLRGELRDIKEINNKNSRYLLMVQNNEKPVLYEINKSNR